MQKEIVITGISGRFPESDDVAEFSQNLYQKKYLVTESSKRYEPGLYGLPKGLGQLRDISKFDNEFFEVSEKQAHLIEPQGRILLETTYEAIVDAGYDPDDLRGRNIGVFIGNSFFESQEFILYDIHSINDYTSIGVGNNQLANRISHFFDFKGQSVVLDTACSSGLMSLYFAVQCILRGDIEAAIVGGVNICLRPGTSIQFHKLGALSNESKCKTFDAEAKGYVRSEAVATIFLQKSDVARRKYASIIHIKSNTDGYKAQGIMYPSHEMQRRLMQEVYQECKLDPSKISYIETHGTGTIVGDPAEVSAIADIFCHGRKETLWIGSVKSNMGHAESASGLCALIKVIICMENSLLTPNLHFRKPNPAIPSLIKGQVRVPTCSMPWKADYAAVSCFGMGGVNVHLVLKSNDDEKQRQYGTTIPQLVLYCGRTQENVQYLFDNLQYPAPSREFFALLHKSAYSTSKAKPYRGYTLLPKNQKIAEIKRVKNEEKPVWYIFNCTSSQLPSMTKNLMEIKIFENSIKKSAEVLKQYGLDLIALLMNQDDTGNNSPNITSAYSLIVATQIALMDILNAVGIVPGGLIGCGVEELLCGYVDGSLTAEQVILASYWTARMLEESKLEAGLMADLGIIAILNPFF